MLLRAEMSKPLLQAQIATFDRFLWRISVPAWFPTRGCSFTPIQAPLPAELPTCRRRPFFYSSFFNSTECCGCFWRPIDSGFRPQVDLHARRCPQMPTRRVGTNHFPCFCQRQPATASDSRREWFWERMQ